jgi:hypothetical protein
MMRYLVALAVMLGLSCTPLDVSTPEEVYRGFYQALAEKNWDRALGFLSRESQDAIARQKTFLNGVIDGDEVRRAFFPVAHADVLVPLKSIDVISRDRDGVTIEVRAGSCTQNGPCISTVKLLSEDGRYVIAPQLPANLTQTNKEGT